MAAWVTVEVEDVLDVLNNSVALAAEKDRQRAENVISKVVARVRGTIRDAGRVPVSATPETVPPGAAEIHVPVLAAWAICSSTPSLLGLVAGGLEGEQLRGFSDMYDAAEEWLKSVAEGATVAAPDDPEGGEDAPQSVRYGSVDNVEVADMSTNGPVTDE